MSRSYSPSPPPKPEPAHIDRQTTTPFLLKLCYRSNAFHNLTSFALPTSSNPQPQLPAHLQVYTWYSCTLRELAHLLTNAPLGIVPDPAVGTRLSFRLVYPDTHPRRGDRLDDGRARYTSRELGSVVISAPSPDINGDNADDGEHAAGWTLAGDDGGKTLADLRFVIGDYVDCAVFPPLSDGTVMPRGSVGGKTNGTAGYGRGRGAGGHALRVGGIIPAGDWRRGERLPGGGSGYGRGTRRGPY